MKKWFSSKTVWFNIITLALGVLGAVLGVVKTQASVVILTVLIAVGNGVLRIWFTDTAIASPATKMVPPSLPTDGATGVPS